MSTICYNPRTNLNVYNAVSSRTVRINSGATPPRISTSSLSELRQYASGSNSYMRRYTDSTEDSSDSARINSVSSTGRCFNETTAFFSFFVFVNIVFFPPSRVGLGRHNIPQAIQDYPLPKVLCRQFLPYSRM